MIRRERTEDHAAIEAVHDAAFSDPAVERATAAPAATGESRLVNDLRDDEDAVPRLCLVALLDAEVVGHVACSRGRVGSVPLLALAPLGVHPSHQRSGVGTALMHAVLAAAEALEEPAVFTLGDPAYYGRFGFEPAAHHGVQPPEAEWGDHFQVRTFDTWHDACSGDFEYPAAFSRL